MFLFEKLFTFLKKISSFLKIKCSFFTTAGLLFIILVAIVASFFTLFKYSNKKIFEIIGLVTFNILCFYIIFLIPLSNNKIKQTMKIVSHKSYFSFLFYFGILLWGMIYMIFNNNLKYTFLFINNSVYIITTLYGVLTIIWFAYHIIYSDKIQQLKRQLYLYIFIVIFIQLFFIKEFGIFKYSISVLILAYTFIQYLFEDNADEKQSNVA